MLSSVSKTYKIDQNTLETDLKSLIDSGELNGAVKSGFYVPNKFLEMKDELVAKTFEDQGFVDYSWIENNFLEKKPKDLIKRLVGGDVIYLKSTALSKKKIEDLREKVAQNLETEGYAESTQIFPSTFDDEDISTLLEEHLGVAGLIVEEHTLILESFIQKCVNKLKENMVQIIEDAENEALQALKPGEKKKKGKSGADKFPLSQNDISKVLQEKKVMEYIVDESQREAFFKHLVPRLDAEYLKLKEEMQNKKVAASSDVVADLSAKVEHLGMTLLLTNRTIKNMLESMPEFDSGAAEAMALSIVRPLVERIVFLNLKRFKIHVEPVNLYKKKAEEVVSSEFDKLSTPVFAEGLVLESLIEKVPKDTREILKEMFTRMSDNNLPKFCAFLEEKGPDIGAPKFNINKKTEKAHTLAFKFFAEDHFKNEENLTKKVCLFFSLIGMGEGLYFWPFLPGKSQRIPLNTIYSALITIKEKFGEKYWPEIETLFKLANRDPPSREDFNEAKPHFKNLQKLA